MNKLLLTTFIFYSITNLNAQDNTITSIHKVLDDWHLAAAEAQFDPYFDAMAPQSIFIGTDAVENWTKKEFQNFAKPYFDKGKAWDFKAIERNIYLDGSGTFAWFDELLQTWMGSCRGSGVLTLEGDSWKIQHYVLSLTIPNEKIDQIIPLKKEKDSILSQDRKRDW